MKTKGVPVNRGALVRAAAETLRHFRLQSGVAQEDLATLAGIDRSYLGRLERGEHAPTLERLLKICGALGITIMDFIKEFDARYNKYARKGSSTLWTLPFFIACGLFR